MSKAAEYPQIPLHLHQKPTSLRIKPVQTKLQPQKHSLIHPPTSPRMLKLHPPGGFPHQN